MQLGYDVSVISVWAGRIDELERTVKSVASQVGVRLQHLIVMPQSRSQYDPIVRNIAPNVTILYDTGTGIYQAMNLGAENAKGTVLVFMNGGDAFVAPSSLVRAFNELPDQFQWGLFGWIAGDRPRIPFANESTDPNSYRIRVRDLAYFRVIQCHQATLIRRQFFTQVGPFDDQLSIAADYEWSLRAASTDSPWLGTTPVAQISTDGVSKTKVLRTVVESHRARARMESGIWCRVQSLFFSGYHAFRWQASVMSGKLKSIRVNPQAIVCRSKKSDC